MIQNRDSAGEYNDMAICRKRGGILPRAVGKVLRNSMDSTTGQKHFLGRAGKMLHADSAHRNASSEAVQFYVGGAGCIFGRIVSRDHDAKASQTYERFRFGYRAFGRDIFDEGVHLSENYRSIEPQNEK